MCLKDEPMPKVIKESDISPHMGEFPERDNRYYLYCPGCYEAAKAQYPDNPNWWMLNAVHCFNNTIHGFNGDVDKPTLSPSLLVTGSGVVCHSYVENGMIRFLGDCTHPLANQTVELLDVPTPTEGENP